jgi:hypothetical protein
MFDVLLTKECTELKRIIEQNDLVIKQYTLKKLKQIKNNLNSVTLESNIDDIIKIISENKTQLEQLLNALK